MKLMTAYVCFACREVFDRAPEGRCPACGSENIQALGWVLARKERAIWVKRISGKEKAKDQRREGRWKQQRSWI